MEQKKTDSGFERSLTGQAERDGCFETKKPAQRAGLVMKATAVCY